MPPPSSEPEESEKLGRARANLVGANGCGEVKFGKASESGGKLEGLSEREGCAGKFQ